MKYFKKTLIGILLIQLFSFIVFMYIGYYQYDSVLKMIAQKKEKSTNHLIKNIFKEVDNKYINYGNELLSDPELIEAFYTNDRKKLLEISLPIYKKLKEQNPYLYIMHFHTKDTHSFLRVHKPEKFGDNLYNLRPIIVHTNKAKKIQVGLETGKYGIYYRITFPIFKDGEHIGAFEFGMDVKYLMSILSMFNTKTPYLLVKNEAVDSIYKYSKNADNYLNKFNDKFSLINFISNKKDSNTYLNLINDRITNKNSYFINNKNKEYLVFRAITLKDYKKKDIGYFIFIEDMQEYMNSIKFIVMISIISIIILFVLTVWLIYKLTNSYTNELKKQVDDRTLELSQALEQLTRSQEYLVESEKMASLGSLVAGVAHEVNTPIGVSLTGITHIDHEVKKLEKNYKENSLSEEALLSYIDTMKKLSYTIHGSLDNASKLIKSFKHISVDQHSLEQRVFNLKEYIDDIVLSLKNKLKAKNVKVINTIDKNIDIDSYPGMFSQVFSNLILNSIKHGFEDNEDNIIEISVQYDTIMFIIDYKDNGIGITPEIEKKIFDPFFTTKRGQGGSGLGLNIVYNLITQKLGGTIKIINTDKKGLNFQISVSADIVKGKKNG